jgi:hypothetical protein
MTDEGPRHPAHWPHPNEQPCADCGHVWFAGERRHEYLDHHDGDHDDVEVLCVLCRRQRGLHAVADF